MSFSIINEKKINLSQKYSLETMLQKTYNKIHYYTILLYSRGRFFWYGFDIQMFRRD